MNPGRLPAGHVAGRRMTIAAVAAAVLIGLVWFYISKVHSGDVMSWYYEFHYEQERIFNSLFHVWHFPWEK